MNKKIIGTILLLIVLAGVMIEAFTYLNPQQPGFAENGTAVQNDFLNQPGISNVQKFTDIESGNATNNTSGGTVIKSTIIRNTIIRGGVDDANAPLPYPRISINYTTSSVGTIRDKSSGENNTFFLVNLDIRNYGYKYFDAHPTRFRLTTRDKTFIPIVNITTGSMIDAVLPNNSRAKGDLVFLLSLKDAQIDSYYCKITYLGDYKIIYSYGIPYEGEATPTAIVEEYP